MSLLLPHFPNPAIREPVTLSALAPLFLSFYAQAVLAILPNTFKPKLVLLPFIVWQAWSCSVGLNFSTGLAQWLGLEKDESLRLWNAKFVVGAILFPVSWRNSSDSGVCR
jgi:hypothetical protein